MNNTSTMVPIPDNIRAAAILKQIKGCKVEDNKGNRYSIVDVKCFNGLVSLIGLENADGVVKYASENVFKEMASVAWFCPSI